MNIDSKNLDKISQSYMGELGALSKQKSRTRIDWICKKVKGKNVLDVGCSQGITSILLGRQNRHVVGIDLSVESIEYAENLKDKENKETVKNVSFIQGDFLQYKFNKKFDTIIMGGGILEHVFKPEMFIDKAVLLLNEIGRVIITVPFGINAFPDHKRTYYFLELFNQIKTRIGVSDVAFLGGWIGFVADKNSESNINLNEQLIEALENSFFEVDSAKQRQIDRYKKEIENMKKKLKEVTEKTEVDDDIKLDKMEFVIEQMEENLKKIELQVEGLFGKSNVKNKEFLILMDKLYQANTEIAELRYEKLISQNELAILNNKIKEKDNRHELVIKEYEEKNKNLLVNLDKNVLKNEEIEQQLCKKEEQIIDLQNRLKLVEDDRKEKEVLENKIHEQELSIEKFTGKIESDELKLEKLNRIKRRLEKEKDSYNTLLYKAKRKNMRYEKLLEVKFYNFLRGIKNKDSKYEFEDAYEKIENIRQKNMGEKRKAYEKLIETADSIPDSNGSRYFKQSDVRIGMIADEFQLETYRDVAEVIYLSPQNYKADIDILFIVSTWHGIKDDWTGLGRPNEEGGVKDDLMNIIKYHRNKGKKICFYSKEDPGNYNVFLYIAKECDYIFTTDCDCIEKYIKDTGNANVFLLPFAINPHIHNPIGFETHMRDEVIFAGTWGMAHKYPERNIDLEILLDGVIASGKDLKIFDRNFYLNNDAYKYPVKYDEYVYPPIEHKILMKVHKLFKWGININSSKYSDTMFASRVYELQACGSLIISNWSLGMKRLFPNIFIEFFPYKIKETFDNISEKRQYELQLEGIRKVYGSETIYHRLNYILDKLGLPEFMQEMDKSVLVIVSDINNDSNIKNFERQSYNNKIIMNIDELTKDIFESADMFTYFDENSYYGEFYLEDMINGFKYTDSDFITKSSYYIGEKLIKGENHEYYNGNPNIYRSIFWRANYEFESVINNFPQCKSNGMGYSTDKNNYLIDR